MKPQSRLSELVVQELDGEVLIYDVRTDRALCLNETAGSIWSACDGTRDIDQIREFAAQKLNAPVNDDLIWLALDQLKAENLIEKMPEDAHVPAGLARRDALKRIALGSLAAIPVITALATPAPAQAISFCGAVCQGNGQCGGTCPTCTKPAGQPNGACTV